MTTETPLVDGIANAHETCASNATLTKFGEQYSLVGDIYKGTLAKAAESMDMTQDEFVSEMLDEMYDAEEDTLSISGAWANDHDYGMDEGALLFGLVQDCVLDALGTPERVRDHMGSTRALDGQQTDSWDDFEARWTYHPDSGTSLTIWTDS